MCENIFRESRLRAALLDESLKSRTNTAVIVGIGKTRLGQIERGEVIPHRDEVVSMARVYHNHKLLQWACDNCEVGIERNKYECKNCEQRSRNETGEFFAG